ncbi:GGDEF domain-containing protein [Rhodococcoides yunnanense]|uniref:Diguanylate cyclase n=1 Tax=Rhodococcoides yunnanense TaxID=278209 RepID=A0ABU4B6X3_9NOCA|nr:diguanylate cyclase [Rhodococcus yunnanensis]MDV6259942.1 diguanylate cyclase [Rhodococcus yunnanensis]
MVDWSIQVGIRGKLLVIVNSLRQWWALPVDYGWNVAYARSQRALDVTRVFIGIWCWLYGAAAAIAMTIPALADGRLGRWPLWVSVVTTVPLGLAWVIGGWPSWRLSIAFVLYADILLAAVLLTIDEPSMVLPMAALFTVIASYVVGFHGPKLFTAHHVFALFTTIALYVSAVTEGPEQRLQTNLYLVMLILVMFSAPLICHTFLMLLRRDATGAFYDPLTGMQNRRGFDAAIGNLDFRSDTHTSATAVVIDLDNFKAVNDRYGHEHGDFVIRMTAVRILEVFPTPAITVRLGGEEFAIVCVDDLDSVIERSELLRIRLCDITDRSPLTASLGIAEAVVEARDIVADINDLLSCADNAMYQAKRLGGDRVTQYVDDSLESRPVDERQ